MDDDGILVEPETYLPVIPLVLVNGVSGIATGYSTDVLPYNPTDIVKAIRAKLTKSTVPELTPWWFGFKGSVTKTAETSYVTKGHYEFVDDDVHTIRQDVRSYPIYIG